MLRAADAGDRAGAAPAARQPLRSPCPLGGALGALDEAGATVMWKLTFGEKPIFALPRLAVMRSMGFNVRAALVTPRLRARQCVRPYRT